MFCWIAKYLRTGEVVTFSNRRMLHGRGQFHATKGGKRHLQGAYINIDEFKSMATVLANITGTRKLPGHVGNGDCTVYE